MLGAVRMHSSWLSSNTDIELKDANASPSCIPNECVLYLHMHYNAPSPFSPLHYCCRAFSHLH